jgi:hypothetical protein
VAVGLKLPESQQPNYLQGTEEYYSLWNNRKW